MSFSMNELKVLAIVVCFVSFSVSIEPNTQKPIKDSSVGKIGEKTEVSLEQAIKIVEKRKLTECVARTICELSCNADTYGPKGMAVYQTLKKFESDTLPKLAFYKTARDKGLALNKTNCNECSKLYVNCKTSTETLLKLANALTIKS